MGVGVRSGWWSRVAAARAESQDVQGGRGSVRVPTKSSGGGEGGKVYGFLPAMRARQCLLRGTPLRCAHAELGNRLQREGGSLTRVTSFVHKTIVTYSR